MGTESNSKSFCPNDEEIQRWMGSAFEMVSNGLDGWIGWLVDLLIGWLVDVFTV